MSNVIWKPKTLVRAWDVDELNFPHFSAEDWRKACHRDAHNVVQIAEKQNRILDKGMETIAAIIAKDQLPWQDGGWYRQALGSSATATAPANPGLFKELIRKPFTESIRSGRIVMTNTFFTGADFASAATTVSAVTSTTVFDLVSATGFEVGDYIRIFLTTGYEFRTILNLVGTQVTLNSALSAVPTVGATVDQVVEEAGLMGDVPAGYMTGTVSTTAADPVVTGLGTQWIDKVAPGDKILVGSQSSINRAFYEILTVDSDTQLTLTTPFPSTLATQPYFFHGTSYNRVVALQYIKLITRGLVLENQWNIGG